MNALLYARVSTEKQSDKDLSIPAQLNAMREYARQRQWTIVEEFIESGASARTTERPALKRMLARCRLEPAVEAVLVHKVDRLARDVYGHATIKALLKQRGIRLASVVENVDDSITGQLVEHIMASIAEFYSANLGEEVKKGMRVMVQRGEWPHLPPRGYAQTRTAENRPLAVPDEVEAPAIAEVFGLYATGRFSTKDIAEELLIRGITTGTGKPLPQSYIRTMLENPFYVGRLRWNGADYAAKHKGIVPEPLFLRVQQMLRHRFKEPGERGRVRYLLRGLATCGECGYRVTAESKKRWAYYRCIRNARGAGCRAPFSNVAVAHDALRALYKKLLLPDDLRRAISTAASAECERRMKRQKQDKEVLRRRRERLLAREVKLTEAFTAGDTSPNAYKAAGSRIRAELGEVDAALRVHSAPDLLKRVDQLLGVAGSLAPLHDSLDLPRQQRLLQVVFARLALDRGDIVDFALKPPFDRLLQTPTNGSKPPMSSLSPQFEQGTAAPAIKSLFGFDFSALEGLLPTNASVGQ